MLIKIYCLKKISKILLEELIGVATSEKDGLMPSIQRMTTSYQKDQQKYCKIAEFRNRLTGISMLISVLEELMPIANLGSKGLLRKGVLSPILVCNKDSVQEVCVVRLASSSNAYIGMILYVYWGGSTGLFFINSKTGNSYIIRKVNGSMISEIEFKRKNDHLFVRSKTNTASFRVSALFLDTTGVDLSLSMNIVDENLDDAEDIEIL